VTWADSGLLPPQTKAQVIGPPALDIPVWQPRFSLIVAGGVKSRFAARSAVDRDESAVSVCALVNQVWLRCWATAENVFYKAVSDIGVEHRTRSARKKVAVWFGGP